MSYGLSLQPRVTFTQLTALVRQCSFFLKRSWQRGAISCSSLIIIIIIKQPAIRPSAHAQWGGLLETLHSAIWLAPQARTAQA